MNSRKVWDGRIEKDGFASLQEASAKAMGLKKEAKDLSDIRDIGDACKFLGFNPEQCKIAKDEKIDDESMFNQLIKAGVSKENAKKLMVWYGVDPDEKWLKIVDLKKEAVDEDKFCFILDSMSYDEETDTEIIEKIKSLGLECWIKPEKIINQNFGNPTHKVQGSLIYVVGSKEKVTDFVNFVDGTGEWADQYIEKYDDHILEGFTKVEPSLVIFYPYMYDKKFQGVKYPLSKK